MLRLSTIVIAAATNGILRGNSPIYGPIVRRG